MESQSWLAPLVVAVAMGLALTTLLSYASASRVTAAGGTTHPRFAPLMGGLAILAATAAASWIEGILAQWQLFLSALAMAFGAGLWIEIAGRTRRQAAAVEVIVAALVVFAAGANVRSLGYFGSPIDLPPLVGLPVATLVVLLVSRCLAPIDVRSFRAWFGFIALAWYAGFARRAGLEAEFVMALLLDGAIAGYLLFDGIIVRRMQHRVSIGHAGGLMIAAAVSVLALEVTQQAPGAVPPVAAAWVVLLPVFDSASVLLARVMRRAPFFLPDERHLHHYLRANDYTESDILFIFAWLTMLSGAVGYFAWKLGMSQPLIALLVVAAFAAYHVVMVRAWRRMAGYYVVF